MRAYFDEQKGSLGSRPATISFRQIVVTPKPSAGGQGPDQGPGRLDRAGAPPRRRLRHRRQALLAGPGLEGPGRLAQLVPPGRDGAGVRAGRVRAQARRDLRPGRDRRSATTSSRSSGSSRPRSRPATSCWCRRSIRRTWTAPALWPTRIRALHAAGRVLRLAAAASTTTRRRTAGGRRAGGQAARGLRQGDRPSRLGDDRAGLHRPGRRQSRAVRGAPGDRRAARRATSATKTSRDHIREQLSQQLAIRRYLDRLRKCDATWRSGCEPGLPRLAPSRSATRAASGPRSPPRALADPLDAEITLVGAEDQIARAAGRPPGPRGHLGPGQRRAAGDRGRTHPGRAASPGHAVETAAKLALAGEVDAIVTAPAHKHALHLAGFPYPGHTEWLAQLAGGVDVAMMLRLGRAAGRAGDDPRAVPRRARAAHRASG